MKEHQPNLPPTLKSFLFTMARPYRWYFLVIALIGIYSAIHGAVQPYVLKVLIDATVESIGTGSIVEQCMLPAGILIAMGFIITFIWRLYNYMILKALPGMRADIIKTTTEYLHRHSYYYFQSRLSGELSAKVFDINSNLNELVNSTFNISRQALTVLIAIGMSALVHPYFAMVFFVVSIGFLFMAYYCAASIKPYSMRFAKSRSRTSGIIVDTFSNISNVILFARQAFEQAYLKHALHDTVSKDQAMQTKNMINATILGSIGWSLQVASIVLLIYFADKGMVSVGDFAFIFILSITVIDQVWFLTESLLNVGEKIGICRQALDTIYTDDKQSDHYPNKAIELKQGSIEFKNVSFAYKGDEFLFEDINVTIPGRKKIGLVGYSGGGKSTFVNLITRLHDVDQGQILIDGQPIDSFSVQSLRENIAFIPQSPDLFHRTLLENIQYGNPNAGFEDVVEAAKKAHIHEFIETLPNGYDTLVGEKGVKLSGGQRQRIAIARAILKDAPILILDEATSSLDSVTEDLIKESLMVAMEHKTVIVIAHRLSTVLAMDEIWVFDKGQIIEQGSHQKLIKANGFYKQLWDAQKGHSFI